MSDVEDFLKEGAPPSAPEPRADPEPEPEGAAEGHDGTPEPDGEDEATGTGAPNEPRGPNAGFRGLRQERNDWKEQAIRAQAERDAVRQERDRLNAELAEARKAKQPVPVQPQPAAPEALPDPQVDPEGYLAAVEGRVAARMFHDRQAASEIALLAKHDKADVEAKLVTWQAMVVENPGLRAKVMQHPDPWRFMYDQAKRRQELETIGDDGLEALLARKRTEWEAEQAAKAPAVPLVNPAAAVQSSLASTRSAAPRSAPVFTGPPAFESLFPV